MSRVPSLLALLWCALAARTAPATIEVVAYSGQPAPGVQGSKLDLPTSIEYLTGETQNVAEDGLVLFHADLVGDVNGSGLFSWRDGIVSKILAAGDSMPGTGGETLTR